MRAALAAVLLSSAGAAAQSVVLRGAGRDVSVALATVEPAAVEVRDPTDGGKRKTLLGAPLAAVLAKLPAPDGADAIAVRCDDGWLSVLPLAAVKRHVGLLAVGQRVGGAQAHLAPPRGPIFLAWSNVADAGVDREPALADGGWTWGVASIEYVRASDFAAPLAPPAGATAAARSGMLLFQQHCQHCHAIRGAGGMAGWDLAQPNILGVRDEKYVRDYILDPRRRNPDGHMKPFKGVLKEADVGALVEYLRALAR